MSSEKHTPKDGSVRVINLAHLSKKYPIYDSPARKLLEFLPCARSSCTGSSGPLRISASKYIRGTRSESSA